MLLGDCVTVPRSRNFSDCANSRQNLRWRTWWLLSIHLFRVLKFFWFFSTWWNFVKKPFSHRSSVPPMEPSTAKASTFFGAFRQGWRRSGRWRTVKQWALSKCDCRWPSCALQFTVYVGPGGSFSPSPTTPEQPSPYFPRLSSVSSHFLLVILSSLLFSQCLACRPFDHLLLLFVLSVPHGQRFGLITQAAADIYNLFYPLFFSFIPFFFSSFRY